MDSVTKKIGFIGAGNMAKAIGKGILDAGLIQPSQLFASAPSETNLKQWRSWSAHTTHNNADIIVGCDVIFLAVKPHLAARALQGLAEHIGAEDRRLVETGRKLFVSIMAGLKIDRLIEMLKENLGVSDAYVIRAMPTTPSLVAAGTCGYAVPAGRPEIPEHSQLVETVFGAVGVCARMDESMINVVGGAFGSGTAFVFTFIDAMASGAVKMGLPWTVARQMAAQTVFGAAKMALETGTHPCELRDEVSSPGGTTIAGLHVLEANGVRSGVMSAVEAAVKRGSELGSQN